jgi:hypothetical protein
MHFSVFPRRVRNLPDGVLDPELYSALSPLELRQTGTIGFHLRGVCAWSVLGTAVPVDIAATLASILGVNTPAASVGWLLTEAIRPAHVAVR